VLLAAQCTGTIDACAAIACVRRRGIITRTKCASCGDTVSHDTDQSVTRSGTFDLVRFTRHTRTDLPEEQDPLAAAQLANQNNRASFTAITSQSLAFS